MPLHTSTCCVVPTPSSTENPVFANLSSPCCSDVQAYSSALWHHRWVWLLQVRHTQPHSLVILGLFKSWPISTAVYNTMAQNLSQWQSFHHCDNHKVALYCGRSLAKWNFFLPTILHFSFFVCNPAVSLQWLHSNGFCSTRGRHLITHFMYSGWFRFSLMTEPERGLAFPLCLGPLIQ